MLWDKVVIRIMESQKGLGSGRDLEAPPVSPPLHGQGHLPQTQLLQTPSNLAFPSAETQEENLTAARKSKPLTPRLQGFISWGSGHAVTSQGKLRTKAQTTHPPGTPTSTTATKRPKTDQNTDLRNAPLSKHLVFQRVQNTPVFVLFLHITSLVSFKKKTATQKERNI